MSDADITQEFVHRLRAFIRKRVRSDADAEDIAQEVMLKFVRDRDSVESGRGPAWMFAVARREIITRFRRAAPPAADVSTNEPTVAMAEIPSTLSELSHCVQPLLDRLQPADRDLLRRVDLEGRSQTDMAHELAVPRSTIKARVQRARKRFHRQLTDCCVVAADARGTPASFTPRNATGCACGELEQKPS